MYAVRNWLIGVLAMLALAAVQADCHAKNIPETIELGSLANLYEKVNFHHARHIMLIKDCAECHHHTTGTLNQNPNCIRCHKNSGATASVACRDCHSAQPFSAEGLRAKKKTAYHADLPGLKGAYHQSCSGCHGKMGGPTGCRECHARNKKGDAFFSADSHAPAPIK